MTYPKASKKFRIKFFHSYQKELFHKTYYSGIKSMNFNFKARKFFG